MWKEKIIPGTGEDQDEPKIFIKKNAKNHSYHQFYPVLAKIRINRGLLYLTLDFITKLLIAFDANNVYLGNL